MSTRTLSLALLSAAAPLLQGCLTAAMWNHYYTREVSLSRDAAIETVYEQAAPAECGQAALFVRYSRPPLPDGQAGDDLLPDPAGFIVFRAPETQVRKASEVLTRAAEAGWRVTGILTTNSRPGPRATLTFHVVPDSTDALEDSITLSADYAWSFAEAPDAEVVPVPLAEPVSFLIVEHRTETNGGWLLLLTPFTLALDACGGVLYVFAQGMRH